MTTRRTTCSRSAGWIAALVLSCACSSDPDDDIDTSMSEHTPTADAGAAGHDGGMQPFDAGSPDAPDVEPAQQAHTGTGDAMPGSDSGEPAADCSRTQAAAIAADLPESASVTELIDALLDKLERAERVPYCSSH